jgi:hypothetical protein
VFLVAVELHDLLLQDSPLLSPLSINSSHHPYCLVVSVTATATWLCYGLDGSEHNATHFAELPPPPTSTSAFSNVPSSASDLPGSKPSRPLSSSAHRSQTQDGTHWPPGACTELNLPPSRSAMMLRTVEQQEQHKKLQPQRQQQQQQQKRELPSHRDDMKAIQAQTSVEEDTARRTGSIQASGWLAWAQARMQEHTRPHSYPTSVSEVGVECNVYFCCTLQARW